MKLIHLSDLHLGKRLCGFSLMEDQEYILNEILKITDEEGPDAVIIAGDVYDKSVPSAEAITLFDSFLRRLADCKVCVLVISGNHDSPERMAFGGKLMAHSGVHLSPVYDGSVEPVVLEDAHGKA
ncbi:MAG: exonuclease subunit SbcD, partial [Clostridia bacterium]|nr:exonuclease subunit SbcD [Clostridia bacterium]